MPVYILHFDFIFFKTFEQSLSYNTLFNIAFKPTITNYTRDSLIFRPSATPCCYNEYLDPVSKRCKGLMIIALNSYLYISFRFISWPNRCLIWHILLACEPGRIGWNCRERCVRGYYGSLCRQKCACSSDHCDPVVGCLTTAMVTSASGFETEDGRKPHGALFVSSFGTSNKICCISGYFMSHWKKNITRPSTNITQPSLN